MKQLANSLTLAVLGSLAILSVIAPKSYSRPLCKASSSADVLANNFGFEKGNPGFETDTSEPLFSRTVGDVSIQTSTIGIEPIEGKIQTLITNFGPSEPESVSLCLFNPNVPEGTLNFSGEAPVDLSQLDEFLNFFGVPSVTTLGLGTPGEGSAIAAVFSITRGESVEFNWNFLTDTHPAQGNDFAFVAISDLTNPGNPFLFQPLATFRSSTFKNSSTTFNVETGFQRFSAIPAQSSLRSPVPVALVIGVVDAPDGFGNTNFASGLLIDGITVPEPASVVGLLAFGACGASSLLRRKQKQQKSAIDATSGI